MMHTKQTLIVGATGQIGSSVGEYLSKIEGWNPIGLARTPKQDAGYPMVRVDLNSAVSCRENLSVLKDATHIVYAARFDHFGGELESKDTNVDMLRNLLDGILPVAKHLKHVHLVHGTKYYGHTIAERRTPYREDDACGNFNSFYFEQQQLLQQRQLGQSWSWSISRPHAFCNYRTDEARNLILVIGVYASILRERGLPLMFPGTKQNYEAKTQFSWLPTLARSVAWMMESPQCANQAYNIVNGDPMSWAELWPLFAQYFNMECGEPNSDTFVNFAADKAELWKKMTQRLGLQDTDLQTLAQWPYGDYVLSLKWDVVSDMSKATHDGFVERVDTPKMWLGGFDYFRTQKIIP